VSHKLGGPGCAPVGPRRETVKHHPFSSREERGWTKDGDDDDESGRAAGGASQGSSPRNPDRKKTCTEGRFPSPEPLPQRKPRQRGVESRARASREAVEEERMEVVGEEGTAQAPPQ